MRVCARHGRALKVGRRFSVSSALSNHVVIVPLGGSGEILIGREDAVEGTFPDLNLTSFGGSAGVSRRHYRLRRRGEQWFVVPFVPANGTLQTSDMEIPTAARDGVLAPGGGQISIYAK